LIVMIRKFDGRMEPRSDALSHQAVAEETAGRALGSGANIDVCTLRRLERQWFMQQVLYSTSQAQLGL
jgi:hypothetical protein